ILNSYGKQFKLSGYTMSSDMGAQKLITDKDAEGKTTVSLPSSFNASVLTKTRYVQTTTEGYTGKKEGTERGEIQMFDEGFIQLAGRISESWGFISEFTADGLSTAKFAGATDIAGGTGGLSLFTSDGFGPFYGQELWSTGIYRPDRLFEDRSNTNAAQVTGIGAHAVTGAALSLKKDALFANVTLFTPNSQYQDDSAPEKGNHMDSTPGNIAYRAAYELHAGDVGGMVGIFGTSGTSTYYPDGIVEVNQVTDSFGIDTEWETHSMVVNAVYATTKGNEDGESIYKNGTSDTTAMSANISYALSNKLFVKGAYLNYAVKDNKTKDFSAITPGVEYFINDNMRTAFEYSMKSYADSATAKTKDTDQLLAMLMIVF
ncbi:MAG: hypothetical protein QG567_2043, partial [Campylobacterota bacterium]|nr:hypothetical protein [Campylobacterota bacterium]